MSCNRIHKIFSSIFTLLYCLSVKGQYFKNDLSINFNPTISSFYGNPDLTDFKSRLTFSIGTTYSHYCSEGVFLQLGMLLERKGANVDIDFFDGNGNYYKTSTITFNRDYLVVPIVCSFVTHTKVKFYYGGGVYLGYLLRANDINSYIFTKESFATETERFDFGIKLGIGFFIPVGDRFLLDFGLHDNLGLHNTLINELATRNNTIFLQMGLKYKF